jgi:hypothetical protein
MQYAPSSLPLPGTYDTVLCGNNQFSFPHIAADVSGAYWEYPADDSKRKAATNHHYTLGIYYMDVATAVVGTVLYTVSDSNLLATNRNYSYNGHTYVTNNSGAITSIS